ncbi:glycosyltransferase [Prevotella bivia DNF00320]|uniref:Glycosyl transferase family 11 n=2 Tax=Prevotella bivia TaxID=28125 RepID=I4Z886_9BACT|nr:hypothetical protein [Prevotella bivia]EFB93458.1 hypothetical protein HMPREF0648_1243 [Prevotella bivia JCVIHMP010]EIM32428.1 Glycosyl transferase family 11 [Prevotella bivia DSM 20514]KGF45946.1 glycosyltransferase [Prevotella bivia DNF00320]
MLFVRDKGRMCNNILQYAHVYAWAREHGRKSMSMRFAYKYPYFHISDTKYHNFFFYLLGKYGAKIGLFKTVSFDCESADYSANETQMLTHQHLLVEGWYVRYYDLFLKYKAEILRLFRFHDDIEEKITQTLAPFKDTIKLGVHIRRGDYARWQGGKYFYNDDQFMHVIAQFVSLYPDKTVEIFICGNDPKLNRDAYKHAFGNGFVHFPNGNPGEDLCFLSHCDYLIGAPSTFTLTASMYHNVPLYWILDPLKPLTRESFEYFDHLFKHII